MKTSSHFFPEGHGAIVRILCAAFLLSLVVSGFSAGDALAHHSRAGQGQRANITLPRLVFAQEDVNPFRLSALSADTGTVVWTYSNPDVTDHSNAFDGRLYVSGPSTLQALNAQNGQILWTVRALPGHEFSNAVLGEDALGLVHIGGDGGMYAFQASTGALVWYSNPNPSSSTVFDGEMIVANGAVYAAANDGIYAFENANGRVLWRNSFVQCSPLALTTSLIYAAGCTVDRNGDPTPSNTLYAFTTSTGTYAWQFRAVSSISTEPRAINGLVYFGTAYAVYAIQESSPTLAWAIKIPELPHGLNALTGGNVYVGTHQGAVYDLAWDSGKIMWRFVDSRVSVSYWSPPLIAGLMYLGAATTSIGPVSGYVYALDPSTARIAWRRATPNAVISPVTVWWCNSLIC